VNRTDGVDAGLLVVKMIYLESYFTEAVLCHKYLWLQTLWTWVGWSGGREVRYL
jgi:hypothetical protein